MTKRYITIGIVLLLIFTLCSCGSSGSQQGSAGQGTAAAGNAGEDSQQAASPQFFFKQIFGASGIMEGQQSGGMAESASKFLQEHPELFQGQDTAPEALIDRSVTFRDVNKNIEKAGAALMVLPPVKITEITEKKLNDGSYYSIARAKDEADGQEYMVVSMKELPGIYQGDTADVTGLPVTIGSGKDSSGNSVPMIGIAAVSVTGAVAEESFDPDSIVGSWSGESSRWGIEFTKEGNTYAGFYSGSGSAATGGEETLHCTYDGTQYTYYDGEYRAYRYGYTGDGPAWITEYSNASGSFVMVNEEELAEYLSRDYGEMSPYVLAQSWEGTGDNARAAGEDPRYLIWFNDAPTVYASEDYVIWYSDTLKLTEEDISFLSSDQIRIARNEIYARHGRRFKSQDLQSHFDLCSWYRGTIDADQFSENVLSSLEKENVRFLEQHENGSAAAAAASGAEGTIFDLMAADIISLYLAENYYNYQSDHDLQGDTYMVADWVGNCIGYADAEMMSLSNTIGNHHEWLFGTDASNNITNNFRSYYTYYFMLKDYYTSNGRNSAASYQNLSNLCRSRGISDPDAKLKQLYNDIQPLITASNNKIRAMKG